LEAGYLYRDGDGSSHTFANSLLRVGILDDVEFRLGWDGYTWASDSNDGVNDVDLGVKWHLLDQSGWQPELSLLGQVTIPVGGDVGSDEWGALLGVLWGYDLEGPWSVYGNLNFARAVSADGDSHAHFFFGNHDSDRDEAFFQFSTSMAEEKSSSMNTQQTGGTSSLSNRIYPPVDLMSM